MSVKPVAAQAGRGLSESSRVFRYLIIGGVGFAIDGGILSLLVNGVGLGPFVSRVPSFLTAVTVTWWFNRKHTFGGLDRHSPGVQYSRYIFAQICGALANLAVYAAAIAAFAVCARFPITALALGAVAGLVVNYILVRVFVFPGAAKAT